MKYFIVHLYSKYTTLNGLNGHFTLNFHYYELTLRVVFAGFESIIYFIIIIIITVVYLHTRDQQRCGKPIPDVSLHYLVKY